MLGCYSYFEKTTKIWRILIDGHLLHHYHENDQMNAISPNVCQMNVSRPTNAMSLLHGGATFLMNDLRRQNDDSQKTPGGEVYVPHFDHH